MRFPTALAEDRAAAFHAARKRARRPEDVPMLPVGPPHNWTLLDGEMVVDEIEAPAAAPQGAQGAGGGGGGSGGGGGAAQAAKAQRRRYLAYDLMMVGGEGVMDLKFGVSDLIWCDLSPV